MLEQIVYNTVGNGFRSFQYQRVKLWNSLNNDMKAVVYLNNLKVVRTYISMLYAYTL